MGQQTMQANKPVFLLMFKMILGFSYFLFIYLSILQKAIFPQNTIMSVRIISSLFISFYQNFEVKFDFCQLCKTKCMLEC